MNWRRYLGREVLGCVVLGLITLALYAPIRKDQFLFFDDTSYVTENPNVFHGLRWQGVTWAFTHFHSGNWHPLTWISLMADAQFYHLNAAGYLVTNVLLHSAATVVLFLLLFRVTGAFWRSLTVAGLFAWHPLHVESVAWISERKDVLSGLFWMLTLCAYAEYAKTGSRRLYAVALVCFAAGLMSKAMLVTLPCVFLLFDFWPLRRLQPRTGESEPGILRLWLRLLPEKLPFFLLAAMGSMLTFAAQKSGAAVGSVTDFPISLRIGHSITSYLDYLVKMVWPDRLAIFYPYPEIVRLEEVLMSFLALLVITAVAIRFRKNHPWISVGWFWYLGTLVPVIGLIQVGSQSIADRYTYIPLIGAFIAVVWAGAAFLASHRVPTVWGRLAAALAIAGCLVATSREIPVWRDTETVFSQALAVGPPNLFAMTFLGAAALSRHQYAKSVSFYQSALRMDPGYGPAVRGYCKALVALGRFDEALAMYRRMAKMEPENPDAWSGGAATLVRLGRETDAIPVYEKALRLKSDDGDAWFNLGNLYLRQHRAGDAVNAFRKSLESGPDRADAHLNLAVALQSTGNLDDAVAQYEAALRLQTNLSGAHFEFGALLLKAGKIDEAAAHFLESTRADSSDFRGFLYLGLLRAGQHRDAEAIGLLRSTLRLAPDHPDALRILAWLLATSPAPALRNGSESLRLAERAVAKSPKNLAVMDTLAAAQAEAGQFELAVRTSEKAIALAVESGQTSLADAIQQRLEFYRAGKPWREMYANPPPGQ